MHNPPLDRLESGDELSRALAKRIRKAEKDDGIIHGAAMFQMDDGKYAQCFIDVKFYPEKQWWLILDRYKTRQKLTPELYERVKRFAL